MALLPSDPKRRAWVTSGLFCLGLMVVPTLVCVAVPRPGAFTPPPPNVGPARIVATAAEESDTEAAEHAAVADGVRTAEAKGEEVEEGGTFGVVVDPDGKPVKGATVA